MHVIRFVDEKEQVHTGVRIDAGNASLIEGSLYGAFTVTDRQALVQRLLPPIEPVNIIAIGLNYRRHAAESGADVPEFPVIFSKLTSSVIADGETIELPEDAPDEVDYEAELAVVIGKRARHVSEADALDHVLGYTCANDVSARDCQKRRDLQWTRAKSFDTFCPLGPSLMIDPEFDPNQADIRGRLNGDVMQSSTTADMIFNVPFLISYLSQHFTLHPGTVILTGTPEGVGMGQAPARYLRPGDRYTVEIEDIGPLSNPVSKAGADG